MKICIVVATLFTARAFLRDQIAALSTRYEVTIAANDIEEGADLRARIAQAPIEREIAPGSDLRALWSLYRLFRNERFDAVHSVTPKAGLLAMLAGFAARVPVRVHTFTGQVWATRRGFARFALKTLDRLTAAAATHVLVDSGSQRDFLRAEGVLGASSGEILAGGSISGVDPARFKPDAAARAAVRRALSIPPEGIVFLFVGRLSAAKGVVELARAFSALSDTAPGAWLLLVGPDEGGLAARINELAGAAAARVRVIGMTDIPEQYAAAADVFVLPSRREGFGSVVIEAAAAGLPAIGSAIYGLVDAIEDGVTGLLVPPGDAPGLAAAMSHLARNEGERKRLGAAARERALRDFPQERLTAAVVAFYERVLGSRL